MIKFEYTNFGHAFIDIEWQGKHSIYIGECQDMFYRYLNLAIHEHW